jgi:histidinol-phosphate/aromatic aminotransferase/cobyric acid decarboxylase-like protein
MIPAPGEHGDDAARVARALGIGLDDVVDLAQTLNPIADDAAAVVKEHIASIGHYPDPRDATNELARVIDVDPARVVLTNGGSEAIALVAREVERGWVDEPEFSLYARHLSVLDGNAGRWRSNPHNPTGRLAHVDDTAAVWDEAFWPITTGTWTRGDADQQSIVVGSLTKLLACPGLRVGYVIAPDAPFAAAIRARQPRWSVNALAASALPDLLASVDLARIAEHVAGLRQDFVDHLRARGFDVESADAPWVLVRRAGLREQLARHAVLVRDCASFGWPDVFRLATPRPDQLDRVLHALDLILEAETP